MVDFGSLEWLQLASAPLDRRCAAPLRISRSPPAFARWDPVLQRDEFRQSASNSARQPLSFPQEFVAMQSPAVPPRQASAVAHKKGLQRIVPTSLKARQIAREIPRRARSGRRVQVAQWLCDSWPAPLADHPASVPVVPRTRVRTGEEAGCYVESLAGRRLVPCQACSALHKPWRA